MVVFYHGYQAGVWYVSESTEGTTPTTAAFLHLAHKTEVKVGNSPGPVIVKKSGDVDNVGIGKGVDNPVITFTINPSLASGADFIKNFGSSDTSFTLLVMIDATPDVIFARITGCKVKRITNRVQLYPTHSAVETSVEIWGWGPILYTASAGVPTFEAAPSSFLNWSNVTVKRNTTTITDWWDFEWTIENDLDRQPDNLGATAGIKRGQRNVTGSWQRSANDGVGGTGNIELDEAKNATAVDLDIVFDLAADHTYTFVDCAYTDVEITHPITGMVGKKMDWTATSFSVA